MSSISVIVPVYNGASCIERCIHNLKEQSLTNLEIVFVDDGSTDNSFEILRKYESEHILVLHQDNAGAGGARNTGLKHASGEYIAFLDVDDKFADTTTLEKLYTKAKQHQALICGGSFKSENRQFDSSDKRIFTDEGWIEFQDYQFDFGFSRFIFYSNLLKKNQIQFPAYRIFEDPVFMLRAMIAAQRFYVIPDEVYLYSGAHQTNISCDKAIDYLHGLRDNLKMSSECGYAQLHYENFHRLETLGSYYAESSLSSEKKSLFKALIDANLAIDHKLLSTIDINLPEDYLVPALQTIWRCSNRYMKIRNMLSIKKYFA